MSDIPKKVICDTNTLLDGLNVEDFEHVIVPIVVVEELDKLKRSQDSDLAYRARKANKMLENADNVEVKFVSDFALPKYLDNSVNDNKIIGFAKDVVTSKNGYVFLSNDLNVRLKARNLGIECRSWGVKCGHVPYTGFKTVNMTEEELADFYENHKGNNKWNLNINEYLLISNGEEIVDKYKWTDNGFKNVVKKNLKSMTFGDLKPKDIYQELAIDSLVSEQFTAISGKAGCGKSLLSLMYCMWAIQNGKYDKLIIMFNPAKVRSAVDQGYYAGNVLEKSLQQFIGHMLNSKFGDRTIVETLINQGKIELVPMSDCRGMEVSDNQILYIPEAQNTNADLMRICLSRASKGAKLIIEGDPYNQVDDDMYKSKKNGILRAVDVFKGYPFFSFVELQTVQRSIIAEIADKL